LTIKQEPYKWLLHCHRGCTFKDICAALGIPEFEMFACSTSSKAKKPRGRGKVVDRYEYFDENGQPSFAVLRWEPKSFTQQHWDGTKWVNKRGETKSIPFGLPELLAEPERPVLIVEGEKDVLTARSLNFLATCNPGGAGKWGQIDYELSERIFGKRKVIIIPDRDYPGISHAKNIAGNLYGIAKEVRLLYTPEDTGKDLTDFVESRKGRTHEQIREELAIMARAAQVVPMELHREWAEAAGIDDLVSPPPLSHGEGAPIGDNGTGAGDAPPVFEFRPGDVVLCHDEKHNIGVVDSVDGDICGITWTNKKDGRQHSGFLPAASLELAWRPGEGEKYRAYTLDELSKLEPPRWILTDYIQEKSLIVIYGEPGSCKTFVALDIAMALASGIGSWHGRPCKQAAFLYALGEGFSGVMPRIRAWAHGRPNGILDGCWDNGLARFMPAVPHLGDDLPVAEFIAYVRKLDPKPEVVVIDTLSRSLAGRDESSAEDMSALIELVDMIRRELGIAVVLIHHCGKDKSRGARGSSALLGGVDGMFEVTKNGAEIVIRCEKAKDWEAPKPMLLKVDRVELGPGPDGPITSLRVRALTGEEIQVGVQRTQKLVVEFLRRPENVSGATAKEIYEDLEISRRTFFDVAKKLIDKAVIDRKRDKRYVLKNDGVQ
jgi:hypothetical protein